MEIKEIESYISKIPDYPKPGILFYDISTLISNNKAFSSSIVKLTNVVQNYKFDFVWRHNNWLRLHAVFV